MFKWWPLIVSTLGAVLALSAILGNVWYPMHDSTHVTRVYLMEQTIRAGQFPPIWAEGVNNGYGYPLFHFYAPLFYYVALGAKLFLGTYIAGIKAALFLFLVVGGMGIFTWTKRWGNVAATVAAYAFLTAPYLAVNIYVRGAFAEIAAISLLPWVFVTWEHISSRRGQIAAAVATALFVISHNLIPLAALPFIAIWVVVIHRRHMVKIIVPAILTLTLAAGYLVPILFERSFVQADQVARTTNYAVHFVYPSQLWNSTWGFGGSAIGIEDGMSFKMGKIQLLLALSGLIYSALRRNKRSVLMGLFAVSALTLSTTVTRPVWDAIPLLSILQFPWRYLGIGAVCVACISGNALASSRIKLIRIMGGVAIICALVGVNLKLFQPGSTFAAQDAQFTSSEYVATISHIIPEFLPKWMPKEPVNSPTTQTDRAYYPTWRATVDGDPVPYYPAQDGTMRFDSSVNPAQVVLTQSHTPLERGGYAITIMSIFAVCLMGVFL